MTFHRLILRLPVQLAASATDEFNVSELLGAGIAEHWHWSIAAAELAMALQGCLRRGSSPLESPSTHVHYACNIDE